MLIIFFLLLGLQGSHRMRLHVGRVWLFQLTKYCNKNNYFITFGKKALQRIDLRPMPTYKKCKL